MLNSFFGFPPQLTRLIVMFLLVLDGVVYSQTADIVSGCAPLQVNFTAPNGFSTYYWDFQDGASSNLENPTNTFANAGNYQVAFRESTTGPIIGTVTIVVFNKPIPILTSNLAHTGCVPLAVDFSASATLPPGISVLDYQWTFGQGSGASGNQVQFTYNNVGSYTVTIALTASTPSCNNTISFVDYVGVSNPSAAILSSPNPPMSCNPPLNVSFTDGSTSTLPLTYLWDFGNGNTSTSSNPPIQSYTTNGNFTTNLTITDTNNCVRSVSIPVSIGSPTAGFTNPDTACMNVAVAFANTSSAGIYNWNFGPNASPSTSNAAAPNVTFTAVGTHTITLTVMSANGQCSDVFSGTIVIENPQLTVTSAPKPQCDTNAVYTYTVNTTANISTYQWTFSDGGVSNDPNPTHDFNIPDTAYARRNKLTQVSASLLATTVGGCQLGYSIIDTVFLIYARFMPDKHQGCAPLTVTFSDSTRSFYDIVNYNYRFGDGTSIDVGTGVLTTSHTFTTPGIYPVVMTATNSLGCEDITDTIWIQVGEVLPLDFTANPTNVCPGESITFTNTSSNQSLFEGWHYDTDGEILSSCYDNPNGTFVFNDTVGTFDVTLSAYYNGCLSTLTKSNLVTVKGPIAKFNYLYNCTNPMDLQVMNQSMGFTSLLWSFGDASTSSTPSLTHTYNATGDYEIILTASNPTTGCPDSKDTVQFSIRDIQAQFVTDSNYCAGIINTFDASASIDVNTTCDRGYKWIFSNPNVRPVTTDEANQNFTFNDSGTNALTLVVTDVNGCTDTLTHTFEVFNLTAAFSISDNLICTPDTIDFVNQTVSDAPIATYVWILAPGDTAYTEDVTKIYNDNNGGLGISLTVTDIHGCKRSTTLPLSFYSPTSSISSNPALGFACEGTPFTFTASDFTSQGSNLIFNWDLGDGTTATGQSVNHTFAGDVNATIKLFFEESASGCKDSTSMNINIQAYPNADFTSDADNLTALCSPQIINFTNTSVGTTPIISTNWTFSNGITNNSSEVVYVFEQGVYTAELVVSTSFGCTDTVIKTFTVLNPLANFTMDQDTLCKGEEITFAIIDTMDVDGFIWDFGDGVSLLDSTPVTHQYNFFPPSGQTVAKLTIYGAGGVCPLTIEKPVYIREVRALFDRNDELDTLLCAGELLNLQNNSTSADFYQWDFGDNNDTITNDLNFTYAYSYSDTFKIQLIVSNTLFGCWDTITKEIIMNDYPVINAIGDTVCIGTLAQLDMENHAPQYHYSWSPANPLSNAFIPNPLANLTQNTEFTLFVTDTITTCSTLDTTQVVVIQAIDNIYFDTTIVLGDFVTLPIDNLDGTINFIWTPDTALSCLTCSYPTYQGLNEITYEVSMTDYFGCMTSNGTFIIKIFPETFLDLPTTFTPNGDGVNDVIYLKGWGIKELLYFKIFNRWGELVFETNDINVGWNGYYKELLQNNDTYTYKAVVKTWKNEELEGVGHINLMR